MNAKEARELMNGSMNYKGPWFKIRLNWLCGRINKQIENAAEQGDWGTIFRIHSRATAQKYFPLMAQFYESLDYDVAYSYSDGEFEVYWDLSRLPEWRIHQLRTNSHYQHHIKWEEPANESNSTSSGDRKNKRASK